MATNNSNNMTRTQKHDPVVEQHQLDSWHSKWEENQITWHESNVHKAIIKYGEQLLGGQVVLLVPRPLGGDHGVVETVNNNHNKDEKKKNNNDSDQGRTKRTSEEEDSFCLRNGSTNTTAERIPTQNSSSSSSSSSSSPPRPALLAAVNGTTTTATIPADIASANGGVRVFFPLCGKTVDMAFLARQHDSLVKKVVGVDGIRKALDAFAEEYPEFDIHEEMVAATNEIRTADKQEHGNDNEDDDEEEEKQFRQQQQQQHDQNFERLVGKKITLIKGDFFELDERITKGRFEAMFDRGSLVAIDPSLRHEYVKTIGKLIQPGGRILLVSVERRQCEGTDHDHRHQQSSADKIGPPFSLPEAEVRMLYGAQDWVESVDLLEEEEYGSGREIRSLFFLIQAKKHDANKKRKRTLTS